MKKLMLIAHVDSYFATFLELAVNLKKSQDFTSIILFPRLYPNLQKHINLCAEKDISCIVLPNLASVDHRRGLLGDLNLLLQRVCRVLMSWLPGAPYLIYLMLSGSSMRNIRELLKKQSPDVIILGGDIVGHDMATYIKQARNLKIRSMILPSWMASAREPAENCLYDPRHSLSRPLNKLFCKFYPRWKFHHKGRDLIRLPAQEALVLETLGLAPPLPWVLHSGNADKVGVESDAAFEYGIREGLDSHRLVVVGSCTHDVLHSRLVKRAEYRQSLCMEYGLDPLRPIVVCALPPDMLYGKGGRPECDFTNYTSLIKEFLVPIGKKVGSRFIVSLHPSAAASKLKFIEEYGAVIVESPIAELIPLADVYVASISATIQWAVACGIPVINYDVYRYRYTDYDGLKEVLTVETYASYLDALDSLIQIQDTPANYPLEQSAVARHWGVLDGKATQRITETLCNL